MDSGPIGVAHLTLTGSSVGEQLARQHSIRRIEIARGARHILASIWVGEKKKNSAERVVCSGSWGIRLSGKAAMVGTRGAAATASSDGGRDRDAGGTSRAQASPSSTGAAAGGNDEKGGPLNNTKVSHDDVVSKVHKFSSE